MTGALAIALVVVAVGAPLAAFTLWPLRGRGARRLLPVPVDAREQLLEQKRQALRALRELKFEHEAGHVSDDDYAELTTRYEADTARLLTELDQLGPAPRAVTAPRRVEARGWRQPLVITAGALALVAFGVALGAGINRHTSPDPTAGLPMTGSRPLATLEPAAGTPASGAGTLSPEMLQGMLQAARSSLAAGRYGEAIAAYQAVLKRQPRNVEAMTHLGLIVAIGGHPDSALETFERALAIDPDYGPALLYRGQVLYEAKRDTAGAIRAWERFLKVVPAGEDHERVKQMIAEAKAGK